MDKNTKINVNKISRQSEVNSSSPALLIKSDASAKNSLRKAKSFPSITNIWNNSIYSFNQNFLKNLPAVDNIVNKLIKSFFTINPLANNPKGKKSKLVQRRYFRLSLNKILVSKSDIKHSNNKVFITVYLFNKKKRSLLLNLKKLYNSFSDKTNNSYKRDLGNQSYSILTNSGKFNNTYNNIKQTNNKILNNTARLAKFSNVSSSLTNKLIVNKYAVAGLLSKRKYSMNKSLINVTNMTCDNEYYNNFQKEFKQFIKYASKKRYQIYNNRFALKYKVLSNLLRSKKNMRIQKLGLANKALVNASLYLKNNGARKYLLPINTKKYSALNNKSNFKALPLYYYKLNNITKYNIHKFITSLNNNNQSINAKDIYNILNKSKNSLASSTNTSNNNVLKELSLLFANKTNLKDFTRYINKYKLYYNLYNNIQLHIDQNKDLFNFSTLAQKPNYSIYKLKSLYKLFTICNNINLFSNENANKQLVFNSYKLLKKPQTRKTSVKNTFVNTNNVVKNQILVNKLNRIDKFFDKYNELFSNNNLKNSLINSYKLNFINEILEKELLYIHYLKLLSYNQAIFKDWFTYPLRNLISKIYNKKVVLNLVNLKYIHLNSDILTQAVDIKLRNFKRNRVVKVLKKIIKLVPISKINIYACDEHSSIYKYVNDHHKRFTTLKFDIFKDLLINRSNENNKELNLERKGESYIPCRIRRLNHEQASTINFIKYKTVFGVRFEAAGRLTKRSTASRSLFKFKYKGSLRNNPSVILNNSDTAVRIKNNRISNLQFTKIASKTRNGSFGLKGWINNN